MTLHEDEERRRRRREDAERRRQAAREQALRHANDDAVMTFLEWCATNGFSEATGRRINERGEGPNFMQLSARRIGVTVGANRAWQQTRRRGTA
jgi:hypothetical protein